MLLPGSEETQTVDTVSWVRILDDGRWRDGFLDPARCPQSSRIAVEVWVNLAVVDGLYFIRPPDWRLLWNYSRTVGVPATIRKTVSRYRERLRNQTFLSVGIGTVVEADSTAGAREGIRVAFVAPRHPQCVERMVLADVLLRPATQDWTLSSTEVVHVGLPNDVDLAAPEKLAGWSPWSEEPLDADELREALDTVEPLCRKALASPSRRRFPATPAVAEVRGREPTNRNRARPSAVLFGYGNYAKTAILPGVRDHLDITRIHEIDPVQIGRLSRRTDRAWDTSGVARPGPGHDVWLIAGYHHTHAPLALAALEAGAVAVVEKPLATTIDDATRLVAALGGGGRRLFGCFQRRYSPFNQWARADLGVEAGQPVSSFSIVYEVPLPARHWYRWPASRSRLTTNGCHWIDHFLYLNDFAAVRDRQVFAGGDDDVVVAVELVNSAVFSMTLTSRGSPRTGLENHVELRVGSRTVKMINDASYVAQDRHRVLRRRRLNRLDAYGRMYAAIAQAIVAGEPGDSARSVEATTTLTLGLEEDYAIALARRGDGGARPPTSR